MKYQSRCVKCYPNGTGYALSLVEGWVAMEFFDLSEASQAKKYAFKSHRKSEAGRDIVYPVNAIAFQPVIQSTQQALQLYRSVEMGGYWLWHQVTHSKRMISHMNQMPSLYEVEMKSKSSRNQVYPNFPA